jgi:tuftelin-interacting protein 11
MLRGCWGAQSLFPEELLAQERVRRGFNHALDMMNQALGGHVPLPQMTPPPPPVTAPSASAGSAPAPRPAELSFKDLVEAFAAQHDLAFVPKAGRTHEGLQVWGFGAVSVVLDLHKQMLHAQIGDRWMPVSLEMLLGEHHQRVSKPGR